MWQKTRGTRQQLIILRRQVNRPTCPKTDRVLLVLLASIVQTWKQALFIVQPETDLAVASSGLQTLLEVQVEGSFSQAKNIPGDRRLDPGDGKGQPASSEQNGFVVSALSLGIHVSKRTIQKDMRQVRATRPRGQTRRTFIHTHAQQIWACDAPAYHCSLLPFAVCLLHHRTALAPA